MLWLRSGLSVGSQCVLCCFSNREDASFSVSECVCVRSGVGSEKCCILEGVNNRSFNLGTVVISSDFACKLASLTDLRTGFPFPRLSGALVNPVDDPAGMVVLLLFFVIAVCCLSTLSL